MKITSSTIQMTSDHYAQESEQTTVEIRGRQGFRGRTLFGTSVISDPVSLGSYYSEDVRSTYSASMTSGSLVRQEGDDGGQTIFQKSMVQRLTSAVTASELAVGNVTAAGTGVAPSGGMEAQAWIRETRILSEEEQVGFSSRGTVQTADGRTIDFSLDLSMSRSLYSETRGEAQLQASALTDPLVISLDGMPPRLTDTRFEFDLDADGTMDEISFVGRGSGFLAFDKNGDGKINDGSELFGPASGDGFEDLAVYDEDGNGWIDENDAVFSQLSVWTRDEDGEDRLISLKDAGLGAIFLGSVSTPFDLKGEGNRLQGQTAASGMFLFENGDVGLVQEVDLAVASPEDGGADGAVSFPDGRGGFSPAFSGPGFVGQPVYENPFETLQASIDALKEELLRILEGVETVTDRWR